MNSPGAFWRLPRSISLGVKRREMQNRGYFLVTLSKHLSPTSSEAFLKSCNLVQVSHQKRYFVLGPVEYLSGVLKQHSSQTANGRSKGKYRNFSITATHSATAAFTTHGDGNVDMDSKEFRDTLEMYSRYQPCPVSIGNIQFGLYQS